MEMSSPANRDIDDDIDIDFDDYQGGVQIIDDDQMLEDADATRPTTATDDVMEDDALESEQSQAQDKEEVMQDDDQEEGFQQQEDEELLDYGEDELLDQPLDDSLDPNFVQGAAVSGLEEADDEVYREQAAGTVEQSNQSVEEVASQAEQNFRSKDSLGPEVLAGDRISTEDALDDIDEALQPEQEQQSETTNQAAIQPPMLVNTALEAQTDTPGTPTDTGLHPMTIRYGDVTMPLFRSRRQLDGLLKDDNLASLSLAELIKNCRQRLALKIGEDISEDQELVLGFDSLGLVLVEDSRSAFESSLNDVLEVYLQLHHNDGTADIPPFSLNMTQQLKFASSFAILKQAAAGGQAMSSFGFLHPEGADEFYQESYNEADQVGHEEHIQFQSEFEERLEEAAFDDGVAEEAEDDQTREAYDQEDNAQTAEEGGQDYVENKPNDFGYEQNQNEEFQDDLDAGEATVLERIPHIEQQPANAVYKDARAPEETEDAETATQLAESNALETTNEVDSTASSTTAQGDTLSRSIGEYEDELIDWDDDSLTTEISGPATVDGPDDFSTFLTEYEDGQYDAQSKGDVRNASGRSTEAITFDDTGLRGHAEDQPSYGGQNFGQEDLLNDHGEQETEDGTYDAGDYGAGHEGTNDTTLNAEHYGDDLGEYDQADNYDEQQDNYNPDYQHDGEDNGKFNDFLAGQEYEHGLEHNPNGGEDNLDDTVIYHEEGEGEYTEDYDQEVHGDYLDFDEPDEPPADDQKLQVGGTGSPLGKRSFDDIDELDDDEPDAKKVKPS